MERNDFIIRPGDPILVTGAGGFIGPAVVASLLRHGFRNLRAFVRPSSNVTRLDAVADGNRDGARIDVVRGNLLSREDCAAAAKDAAVIFHLASGNGKSFPDAFANSVVATRNLLEASLEQNCLRRFVNTSSFAVYANTQRTPLDETSPVMERPESRGEAYPYAKAKQDDLVAGYGAKFGVPHVTVRPGSVFGPGKNSITGRVGIDSFGVYLHLGGSNRIPLTYVDNCADAIVLAGLTPGVEGEVFNIVDDNLPTSRKFLSLYKRHVKSFRSLYVPHSLSFLLCWMWEKYSGWSECQLPPAFNRSRWRAEWKRTRYSNEKLKSRLGWSPNVSMTDGLDRYFQGCRETQNA